MLLGPCIWTLLKREIKQLVGNLNGMNPNKLSYIFWFWSLASDQVNGSDVFGTFVDLRLTLLCMLILAKHCYFVVEQPAASLLATHPRWDAFCNSTCYVPRYFIYIYINFFLFGT